MTPAVSAFEVLVASTWRAFPGLTQAQVGTVYGVSRSWVNRAVARVPSDVSLSDLRGPLHDARDGRVLVLTESDGTTVIERVDARGRSA